MAASGTDKIIFDDLTGVKVGDRLALSSNPHSTITYEVTELNPDHDNKNECLVSPNFTAADNTAVRFTRSREYTLNIEEYDVKHGICKVADTTLYKRITK